MSDKTSPTQSLSAQDLPLEPVRLLAISGPAQGARATLNSGTMTVGASSSCDLRLEDKAVSRQHASVELLRGAVRVRDLGSRNGLLFLGARVETAIIPIGASLTFGRTVVRVAPVEEANASKHTELHGVIAESRAMRELLWRLERAAATEATVVIRGPTGAGKEAVARALHAASARGKGPLEFFDCAAARGDLLESDLFGHVKGAFTGAVNNRVGLIEQASRGTLVLDNVDHLPLELQTRLLRFLEERTVRPVGGSKARSVDVRVLATTQSTLEEAVEKGRLRSDLYYRLAEVVLEVPPLSRRLEDIPVLAARFAQEAAGMQVTLSKHTVTALQAHPWPGNARELKNAVARCLAFGRLDSTTEEVEEPGARPIDLKKARARVVSSFEADFLRALLRKHQWNVLAAAKDAKIARSHLYTLISKYGLSRDEG